jgi:hypothetical protein
MDMVVNGSVLVEVKSCASIGETECNQLFNYLRASSLRVGLLLHFGPRPAYRRFVWTGRQFHSKPDLVSSVPFRVMRVKTNFPSPT